MMLLKMMIIWILKWGLTSGSAKLMSNPALNKKTIPILPRKWELPWQSLLKSHFFIWLSFSGVWHQSEYHWNPSFICIYMYSAKVWVVVKRLAMVNLLMKGLVMIVGVFRVPYSLSSWIRSPVIRGTRGTSRY